MMAGTVHDVALVFEGGGMRNSYSAVPSSADTQGSPPPRYV